MTTPEKAQFIKLLILDVDGVLTSGVLYYGENEELMRGFNLRDGLGIKLLQKSGINVAIISAKKTNHVAKRLAELNIEHVYLGLENKISAYNEIKSLLGLEDKEIAYMGDDLADLPPMMSAGFAITVGDASAIMFQHADYITKKMPGDGAVREVCELLLKAQGKYESVIQSYLQEISP